MVLALAMEISKNFSIITKTFLRREREMRKALDWDCRFVANLLRNMAVKFGLKASWDGEANLFLVCP